VRHRRRLIEVAAPVLMRALDELGHAPDRRLLLIARRELRSRNSWMHKVPRLVAGKKRCVLFVHPADAARIGVADGGSAIMVSRIHCGEVTVHVTSEVREGVVSLPHGYGHGGVKRWQRVAGDQPGASANDWVDDGEVESVAGVSILNGVRVELAPASSTGPEASLDVATSSFKLGSWCPISLGTWHHSSRSRVCSSSSPASAPAASTPSPGGTRRCVLRWRACSC
jgi:hypothetical protein